MVNQGTNITVREAVEGDVSTIAAFNRAMAVETEGKELDAAVVREGVAAIVRRRELGFYLVAEVGGNIAGQLMITTEWSDWRNGYFWWIQSVYVKPEFRRVWGLFQAVRTGAGDGPGGGRREGYPAVRGEGERSGTTGV